MPTESAACNHLLISNHQPFTPTLKPLVVTRGKSGSIDSPGIATHNAGPMSHDYTHPRSRFSGPLSPAHGFMLAVSLYFLLHFIIRVSFSDSLEMDEAEQFLFSQWLDWGYSSQPPLYTWIQQIGFLWLGHSVAALALIKNLGLCVLYGMTFLLARRVLGDETRAILAALSLLLMPPIAWEASRDLTHTILVACWVPASILIVLQLLERKTLRAYCLLGLVLALGLLSKYNYSLHIAVLLLALVSLAEGRRVIFDRRMLLTLLIVGAMYGPHGLWMLEHRAVLASGLDKLGQSRGHDVSALWKLGGAALAYIAPFFVLAGLILHTRKGEGREPTVNPGSPLLSRYWLVLILVLLVAVWFIDAGRMRTRWLFPFMTLIPIWLFTHIPLRNLNPLRHKIYLGAVGLAASIILGLMLLRIPGAVWTQKPTDLNLPFSRYAERLREAGFDHGLIVAYNAHLAGNLLYQFSGKALVLTPHLVFPIPADYQTQPMLVFWDTEKTDAVPPKLQAFVQEKLGQDISAVSPAYLQEPYRYSDTRVAKMGYILLPGRL